MLMRCRQPQHQSFNNMGRSHRPNISFKTDVHTARRLTPALGSSMRSTGYLSALLVIGALGFATYVGHALLVGYVTAHLPLALCHDAACLLLLPGFVSATITGFLLAVLTMWLTPRFAVISPILAALPSVALHIWAWITFGHWNIWWIVLSDIVFLIAATYGFAALFRWLRFRLSPGNSSKRTRVPRAA